MQVPHGIGLASGTDALILALRACGVRAGDEVILPPFTFVATGSAVSALNAKPVFADIASIHTTLIRRDRATHHAADSRHRRGSSLRIAADMDPIAAFARLAKIPVIEDNAQAIGATYKGMRLGHSATRRVSAFIPQRISALTAMRGWSSRIRRNWTRGSERCAIMGRRKST